jgi:hypothetical protein
VTEESDFMTQETPEQIAARCLTHYNPSDEYAYRMREITRDAIAAAIQAERERAGELDAKNVALTLELASQIARADKAERLVASYDRQDETAGEVGEAVDTVTEVIAIWRERAEKAEQVAVKLRSGWSRVRDLAIAGNGPTECFNFQEAVRLEDGKCVETVIRYLNSTVDRAEKAERELEEAAKALGELCDALVGQGTAGAIDGARVDKAHAACSEWLEGRKQPQTQKAA